MNEREENLMQPAKIACTEDILSSELTSVALSIEPLPANVAPSLDFVRRTRLDLLRHAEGTMRDGSADSRAA